MYKIKKVYVFLLLLLFVCCLPLVSQSQSQLTQLSLSIKDKLIDLKVQSANMTLLCETLQKDLTASQIEVSQWEAQSTTLSNSLTNINEQLNSAVKTMAQYEQQLKTSRTVLIILFTILCVAIVCKILGYILYAKGIKLPRWLDILL